MSRGVEALLEKMEKLWTSISETAPRKKFKLGTWKVLLMGNVRFFFNDIIGAFVMTS